VTQNLTLQQVAMGAGFESLADLAAAAKVTKRTVYHANIGIPPSKEVALKIIRAIAKRDQEFEAKRFMAAIREGMNRSADQLEVSIR